LSLVGVGYEGGYSGLADYLKIPEVARRLDVSEPTVRRMVKGGKLPSVFIGGAYRVSEKDLEEYLESAKVTPGKAPRRSPSEPSLFNGLEDERRVQFLRTWESFIRQISGRWHARITEREELDLEVEPAWVEELQSLHLEIAVVVIQGLLRGWDESTASEREKNLMRAIANALDYLGEVTTEAFQRARAQEDTERRKEYEAEIRRATDEIQRRIAG
jgi:excisionase family DNA binding protein